RRETSWRTGSEVGSAAALRAEIAAATTSTVDVAKKDVRYMASYCTPASWTARAFPHARPRLGPATHRGRTELRGQSMFPYRSRRIRTGTAHLSTAEMHIESVPLGTRPILESALNT